MGAGMNGGITNFDLRNQAIEEAKVSELKRIAKALETIAEKLDVLPKEETMGCVRDTLITISQYGVPTR